MGPLDGLGQRGAVLQVVVAPVEAEGLADRRAPQPGQDGVLLLEALEALAQRREGEAVGRVLGVVPTGPEAQLDSPGAHGVDLRHLDGEQTGLPKRGRGDHRAQADALGLPGDGGQGEPRSVGPGSPSPPMVRKWSERKKASKPAASAACAMRACCS